MTSILDDARRRDGRWFRVALYGILTAGWGANFFKDRSDLWLTIVWLLMTTVGLSVLVWELTTQARRQATTATRWSRSDTVNASVMAGYAVLLCAAVTLGNPPQHEQTSGAIFAALYLALGAYFLWLRRRTCTAAKYSNQRDRTRPNRIGVDRVTSRQT